jgi:hypothetical protein
MVYRKDFRLFQLLGLILGPQAEDQACFAAEHRWQSSVTAHPDEH